MLRWETKQGPVRPLNPAPGRLNIRDLSPNMITATGGTLLKNKLDFSSVLLYNKIETNVLFDFSVRPKRRKMR